MATATSRAPTALRITRTFPVPRERVFQAWTEPQALARWFAPTGDYRTTIFELDLRPGGRYRIEMLQGEKPHEVAGRYVEIRPPERLVFTWKWENEPAHVEETIVTLDFFDRGGSTELVLTHDRFENPASRDEHDKGWAGCLGRLADFLGERS
jgi:uncharacterized protein YndB with AHSA1/START domain